MDISSAYTAQQTTSVFASTGRQSAGNRTTKHSGGADSVSISDEARALFAQSTQSGKVKQQEQSAAAKYANTTTSAAPASAASNENNDEIIDLPLMGLTEDIYPPQLSTEYAAKSLEKTRKNFEALETLRQQFLTGKIKKQEYEHKLNELNQSIFTGKSDSVEMGESFEYLELLNGKYNELLESYKQRFGEDFELKNAISEEYQQFKDEFYQMLSQDSRITGLMDSLGIDRSKLL